ncbi:hypothetical protein ABB29_10890 [Pseudoxanthomonas dokdonensis]|uniref:Uncharacterized protein n=1 Tax=Pseudoxanthomonas dokdonensis TaxID=344882 RepID=A0A0R0CGJ2_9GAMM|nr:hypothetical protein ABB29_10890 [Pseudoxanthomonas dokdonensis]
MLAGNGALAPAPGLSADGSIVTSALSFMGWPIAGLMQRGKATGIAGVSGKIFALPIQRQLRLAQVNAGPPPVQPTGFAPAARPTRRPALAGR